MARMGVPAAAMLYYKVFEWIRLPQITEKEGGRMGNVGVGYVSGTVASREL